MKKINPLIPAGLLILVLLLLPGKDPGSKGQVSRIIQTGFGPEDMVQDLSQSGRLLVSCNSRREEYGEYGEVWAVYPDDSLKNGPLKRLGEPIDLVFKPHGISITKENNEVFLYVISHDEGTGRHPVIRYRVEGDLLVFHSVSENALMNSPNALHAFNDGSFLVCNDARKRGSIAERLFRMKSSNIVFFDGGQGWTVVADKMAYLAGLTFIDGKVYASAALENKVYSFDFINHQLENKSEVAKITGPDNIRLHGNKLIVACHSKPMAFIRHVGNKEKLSPGSVYAIDTKILQPELLFSNDGSVISGNSTALIHDKHLYISQIFEPWIIEVKQ